VKKNLNSNNLPIFGRRLREARKASGLPQEQLGVLIGLDEYTASARISRYESGIHQPPIQIAQLMSKKLAVPLAFLYCDDDHLARVLLKLNTLSEDELRFLENWLDEQTANSGERHPRFR
jgi:transcriptional regulator with XRE-family HTH domain